MSRARHWMIARGAMVIFCVPAKSAKSAMMQVEERSVGGLGGGRGREVVVEVDIIKEYRGGLEVCIYELEVIY